MNEPEPKGPPAQGDPPPSPEAAPSGPPPEAAPLEAAPLPPAPEPPTTTVRVVFYVVLFLTIGLCAYVLWSFVNDLVLGLLIAGLVKPIYDRLLPVVRGRAWLASAIVSAGFVVLVAIPVAFLVVSLSQELSNLYQWTKGSLSMDELERWLFGQGVVADNARRIAGLLGIEYTPEVVRSKLGAIAGGVVGFLYENVNGLLQGVFAGTYHFLLTLLSLFYLLMDGDRLGRFIVRLSPLPDDEDERIAERFRAVGRATVVGNGVAALGQGVLGGLALAIAGVPSPILWGTVMTILAFLPLVGIALVFVPACGWLVLEGRYVTAAILFAFSAGLSFFFDNVAKTKLMGQTIQMHDLLMFLSILGGIGAFGIIGLLYGPLVVALFLTVVDLYFERYREAGGA